MAESSFLIVGGGLGGALLAVFLGRAGYEVDVYEMREDLRTAELVSGRSINLALSHRGIAALERVGLADDVLKLAVPMSGRMIHAPDGHLAYQSYGKDETQVINSVSRGGLNIALLQAAGRFPNVRLHFHQKCTRYDLDRGAVEFEHTLTGERTVLADRVVLSADGAFSAVRRALQRQDRFDYNQEYLGHGYKELTIPPAPGGGFALEKNALHIWPRQSFMMIALPNADASFTCTLFWPHEGPNSFAALTTEADVLRFFREQFPDAVPHMPALGRDYFANPTGSLVTIRCGPWHRDGKVLLLGDAAHAVVPFYGQGMNAAFEDVLVLDECMKRHAPRWSRTFEEFYRIRKPSTDALADLAYENFIEMRDHTGSRVFLLRKKAEKWLNRLFPQWWIPLYTMVTFTRMPYELARRRAQWQNRTALIAGGVLLLCLIWLLARID